MDSLRKPSTLSKPQIIGSHDLRQQYVPNTQAESARKVLGKSPPPKITSSQIHHAPYQLRDSTFTTPFSQTSSFIPPKAISHSWRKIVLIVAFIIFCVFLVTAGFFIYKSLAISHSIQLENNTQTSFFSDMKRLAYSFIETKHPLMNGEERGRINILLLGRAGEHYPGRNLTDTVMLMSIDTLNKKVALLSLPRDLYAPIPGTNFSTKINSLYQYGLSQKQDIAPLRASIETITEQPVDYFFILDFDGFEKVVDALHGISIDVVRDFHDPLYPGKNYSYETFDIKKGWQTLDGATALKYVRERHNDPEGDFGRAKRQQQVIGAIKDKAFSLGTFLNVFIANDLLNALGESVKTDMPPSDMADFLQLTKSLDTKNITSLVVDAWKKDSLLRVSHIQVGPVAAFILVPRVGNWNEVRDLSNNIFHLNELATRHSHIVDEKPTLTILSAPQDIFAAQKIKQLATEEMGFSDVLLVSLTPLENRPDESMIIDKSDMKKPFSLDELLKKFLLKKTDSLPFSLPTSDVSDFTIVIGKDMAEALSFDEDAPDAIQNDTAFPEVFPPQPILKRN